MFKALLKKSEFASVDLKVKFLEVFRNGDEPLLAFIVICCENDNVVKVHNKSIYTSENLVQNTMKF